MHILNTLRFIIGHPLNVDHKLKSLGRFVAWQVGSRLLSSPVAVDFVGKSRLLVKPGMTGATGNIYTGLHEFEDMAFVLHFLRPDDLFVDVGANVGAYTVLAGAAVGAKCLSIEPIPDTFIHLMDNINLNGIWNNVEALNIGAGRENGMLEFTTSLDCTNHVVTANDKGTDTLKIKVRKLDDIVESDLPVVMKIDVEGFETEVVAGADNVLSEKSLLAVIMELNGSGKRYGYDELTLHKTMFEHGFYPFRYAPFERKLLQLGNSKNERGNTLYLRNVEKAIARVKSAPKFFIHAAGKEI